VSEPPESRSRDARQGGLSERLKAAGERIIDFWIVRRVRAVLAATDAAGGPLMSAALAFSTMFAILPGLLLVAGVLGWAIEDPIVRADVFAQLVAYLPPLEEAISDGLERVVRERGTTSLVALVGLLWGASNFYAALDEVMRRFFPGGPVRGFVERRVRGVVAISILIVLVLGTIALGGIWSILESLVGPELLGLVRLGAPLLSLAVMVVVVLMVYRLVPTMPPTWRDAWLPALVAGIVIGLITNLFSLLAPVLIGGLSGFGIIAAVFGAFVWLNLCFQVLLYGAAWARYRRDRARLRIEETGSAE
jgi:membrane protein